jgi:ribosome-associated toxin RatA of RatAB toxin-antitoxin module
MMKERLAMTILRAAAVTGWLLSAALPAQAIDLDAAALATLAKGEPVTRFTPDATKSAAGVIEAVIDVPAPTATVFAVVTDCGEAPKVFNGVTACQILSGDPNGESDVRAFTISWSRLLPTVRSEFRSTYTRPTDIRFQRTGGDLERLDGTWRFEALGPGSTRIRYRADIAVGLPVPSALIRVALESDMPKTLKAIRAAAIARK